jgi:hypothetical protein
VFQKVLVLALLGLPLLFMARIVQPAIVNFDDLSTLLSFSSLSAGTVFYAVDASKPTVRME